MNSKKFVNVLLLLFTSLAFFQTNAQQTLIIGTGSQTSYFYGPLYRSSATSVFDYSNYVYGYSAQELSVIPSGAQITELSWEKANNGSLSGNNFFEILMQNSASASVALTTNYTTETNGFTTVYSDNNYTVPATIGWHTHVLSTPFVYTGGDLKIATGHVKNGTASGVINYAYEPATGFAAGIASSSATISSNFTTSYSNNRPNLRITYVSGPCTSPPSIDSLVATKTSPCSGELVGITAFSSSFGLGTTFRWQSSKVGPNGPWTTNNTDTLTTINFTDTSDIWWRAYEVCSGVADTTAAIHFSYTGGPMQGFYAINTSQATGGNNYQNLQDFVDDLNCNGVGGPILLDIAPNSIITGGVEFKDVAGLSSSNFLIINGNGATITDGAAPYIMRFSNVSNITVSGLNVVNTALNNPIYGLSFGDDCQHITIENCLIDAGTDYTSSLSAAIVSSSSTTSATGTGSNAQYLTIKNNEIVGGYYGIRLNGNSSYLDNYGHLIENNVVRDFYLYGIYLSQADSTNVFNNDISRNTRLTLSTFYGFYMATSRNIKVHANKIHDAGIGSFTSYPFYITTSVNSAGFESEFINNLVYNIQGTSTIYGMYFLGTRDHIKVYHNTIDLDLPQNSTGTIRAMFASGAPNNHDFRNNIFSIRGGGSGTKHNIYFSTTSTSVTSDNNVLYNASTGGFSNFTGYWSATSLLSLNDWTNATALDSNSSASNPSFANASSGNLMPLSPTIDNLGTNVNIAFDIDSTPRSLTAPDVGAYEFTGLADDLALIGADVVRGDCPSTQDTIRFEVENNIGNLANFPTDPLEIVWEVSGPLNYKDSLFIFSDTLGLGQRKVFESTNLDLSIPGIYNINAWIKASTINLSSLNDTLLENISVEVRPVLSVFPKNVLVTSSNDTVNLEARSPFIGGNLIITEICHYRTGNGEPNNGWPSWLVADDYIEITGPPGFDMAGYTLEQWQTSLTSTHTFDPGTVIGPNGTAIIAVGQLNSSQPSPSNYYYHGNGNFTGTFGSSGTAGRILFDPAGNIVDAVGYGNYSFPLSANVPASEWSLPILQTVTSTSGMRLIGPDDNTSNNWVVANSSPHNQDPNELNSGVAVPSIGTISGLEWVLNNNVLDSTAELSLGTFSSSGFFEYIVNFNSDCGMVSDTSFVTVALPFVIDSLNTTNACEGQGTGSAAIYPSVNGLQPFQYNWSTNDTTQTIDGLNTGIYSVTVSDAAGIQQQIRTFNIASGAEFSFDITESDCFGDTGSVTVIHNSGPNLVSINWGNGDSGLVLSAPSGTYAYSFVDAVGCNFMDSVTILSPDELTSNSVEEDPSCNGFEDGSIDPQILGGVAPYNYNWSNGNTTAILNDLSAGNYQLTITDANNCELMLSYTLLNPDPLDTTVTVNQNQLTANQSNAFYQWFDCNTGADIPAAQGRLYVTGVSGFFGVKISVDRCTLSSDCYQVIMANVDELDNESKWVVFPNPNNGNFTVQSTKSTQLILINALGQTVESVRLNTSNQYSSELSGLSSGIYFLIDAENPNNQRKKIVVY